MLRFQALTRSQQLLILLYSLATLVLWVFVWSHAFGMDMTNDEAYSYRLVKTNYFIAMFGSANTHWLNSFFMEIFNMALGDSPGVLRLHSVLAFPFFAWAIYRLGQFIKGLPAQLIFYALILFNPYVLDFFSLARGYGLAMTFQAWSLVYFIKANQIAFNYRVYLMLFVLNALSIASNLSYFYTVVGMAGFYVFFLNTKRKFGFIISRSEIRLLLLYTFLFLLTIADLLFIKYYGKDLGYGGDANLIGSLFGSVWEGSLYSTAHNQLLSLLILTYGSFYGVIFVCAYYSIKVMTSRKIGTGHLLSIPLIFILVLNIVFHALFKTPFLYGRTALQWYVPGMLLLCFAVGEWVSFLPKLQRVGTIIAAALSISIGIFFYCRADRRLCFEYSLQANSRKAIYDLHAQQPRHPAVGFSIGGVYDNYYTLIDSTLLPVPDNLPDSESDSRNPALRKVLLSSDYIITAYPVTIQALQQMGLRYEILQTYPPGNNQLIKIFH